MIFNSIYLEVISTAPHYFTPKYINTLNKMARLNKMASDNIKGFQGLFQP